MLDSHMGTAAIIMATEVYETKSRPHKLCSLCAELTDTFFPPQPLNKNIIPEISVHRR